MVLDIFGLAGVGVLVLLAVLSAFLVRLVLVRRGGASVDCGLRAVSGLPGGRWRHGLARYSSDDFEWFRLLSLGYRPTWTFVRHSVEITGRRLPHGAELLAVPHGAVAVTCAVVTPDGVRLDVELAMSSAALTGFLAWIESSAPGAHARGNLRV